MEISLESRDNLPALWPPAGSRRVRRNGRRVGFGGAHVVRFVGLAPALQGPPRLLVHREGSGALLRHLLRVQLLNVRLVAARPALHGPPVVAVHGEEVQLAELLPQPE
jgi:hypothetical protein